MRADRQTDGKTHHKTWYLSTVEQMIITMRMMMMIEKSNLIVITILMRNLTNYAQL